MTPLLCSIREEDVRRRAWGSLKETLKDRCTEDEEPLRDRSVAAGPGGSSAEPCRCAAGAWGACGGGVGDAGRPGAGVRIEGGDPRRRMAGAGGRGSQPGGADLGDPPRAVAGAGRRRLDRDAGAAWLPVRRSGGDDRRPARIHGSARPHAHQSAAAADLVCWARTGVRRDQATVAQCTPAHAHRNRRHRQDPAGAASGRRSARGLSRWRLVRRPVRAGRSNVGAQCAGPGVRCEGVSRAAVAGDAMRASARQGSVADPRQLRASAGRVCRPRRGGAGCDGQGHPPRYQPRAAARGRRAGLSGERAAGARSDG